MPEELRKDPKLIDLHQAQKSAEVTDIYVHAVLYQAPVLDVTNFVEHHNFLTQGLASLDEAKGHIFANLFFKDFI